MLRRTYFQFCYVGWGGLRASAFEEQRFALASCVCTLCCAGHCYTMESGAERDSTRQLLLEVEHDTTGDVTTGHEIDPYTPLI